MRAALASHRFALLTLVVTSLFGCTSKPALEGMSIEQLSTMLADEDASRRAQAAHELGRRGPEALVAQYRLIDALNDQELRVRTESAIALGKIGPQAKAAVLPLAQVLEAQNPIHRDSVLRRQAAVALGKIGDPLARPALEKALVDPTPIVKNAARDSFVEIEKRAAAKP